MSEVQINEINPAFFNLEIQTRPESCEQHGAYDSRNIFGKLWSRCPTCEKDRRDKENTEREERDREEKRARWMARLGFSGIPERFRERRLANYTATSDPQRHALSVATSYAEHFATDAARRGRSLVFIGRPGTGKTHLAVGIGLSAMEAGYSVLFLTVMRAIRRVKDTWGKGGDEKESAAMAALVEPDLLILDEVGIQFGSETEKLILFDLLNERYERRKPCILLSNLTLDEVSAYLGERILDRLREDGGEVVPFNWDSHRGKA